MYDACLCRAHMWMCGGLRTTLRGFQGSNSGLQACVAPLPEERSLGLAHLKAIHDVATGFHLFLAQLFWLQNGTLWLFGFENRMIITWGFVLWSLQYFSQAFNSLLIKSFLLKSWLPFCSTIASEGVICQQSYRWWEPFSCTDVISFHLGQV